MVTSPNEWKILERDEEINDGGFTSALYSFSIGIYIPGISYCQTLRSLKTESGFLLIWLQLKLKKSKNYKDCTVLPIFKISEILNA